MSVSSNDPPSPLYRKFELSFTESYFGEYPPYVRLFISECLSCKCLGDCVSHICVSLFYVRLMSLCVSNYCPMSPLCVCVSLVPMCVCPHVSPVFACLISVFYVSHVPPVCLCVPCPHVPPVFARPPPRVRATPQSRASRARILSQFFIHRPPFILRT